MFVVDLVIVIGWVAFWIYWLVASAGTKAGRSRWGRYIGLRGAIILLVILLIRSHLVRTHAIPNGAWLEGIGLAVFALGLALAVWARIHLGRNWGMPMSEKLDPELVTTGPYSRIRHPIYAGLILGMTGTAIALTLYGLIAVALLGAYFIYSAVVEERNMTRQFPESYPHYRQSTKMLVPFIF